MIVGMYMTRSPLTVAPEVAICAAARTMAENRIRRLPVVRSDGKGQQLLGLVSATDLFRAFPANCNPFGAAGLSGAESNLTVRQVMAAEVVTTCIDTPLEEAARMMRDRKLGALPVVTDNRLVGIITESDIFKALINLLEGGEDSTRITFTVARDEDVFEFLAESIPSRNVRVHSLMSSRSEGKNLYVVRVSGKEVGALVEDLWRSGHQVLNVLR
jgi:acetoin utilization protein AcuB